VPGEATAQDTIDAARFVVTCELIDGNPAFFHAGLNK
jgi:hypothetical protein